MKKWQFQVYPSASQRCICVPEHQIPIKSRIPCPFIYIGGEHCTGYIQRIERYRTTAIWEYEPDKDIYSLGTYDTGSHWHLFCSEKGTHSGYGKEPPSMKFWTQDLPQEVRDVVMPKGANP